MNTGKEVMVVKANGEEELFDVSKLERSLKRAGASSDLRKGIAQHIVSELIDGMTTAEIYRHAFEMLKKRERKPVAARYSVKQAIFDLGPSGYPFEQFVSEILKAQGWHTKTGVGLNGKCAPHEVDVCATKESKRVGIEVKFHNSPGTKTDIKDTLYVHARFEDLKATPEDSDRVDEGWLVTNTRFSRNAVRYGRCVGLTMLGWDYPEGGGILDLIEESKVHPLTCLTTLTEGEKRALLKKNIVLCQTVQKGEHLLKDAGVQSGKIGDVLEEARRLCTSLE